MPSRPESSATPCNHRNISAQPEAISPWVARLATLCIVVSLGMLVFGATSLGASWNEGEHQQERVENFFAYGWHVTDEQANFGDVDFDEPLAVYGPVYDIAGHYLAVLFGVEALGEPELTPESYLVRHLLAALIGFSVVAISGAAVWVITGSRRAGIVTAAILFSFPLWLGHSMFNPKDLPVAFGYTSVTAGLLFFLPSNSDGCGPLAKLTSSQTKTVGWLLVLSGVVLGVGTRPAMLLPFLLSLFAFFAICLLAFKGQSRVSRFGFQALWATSPFAVALAVLGLLYPNVFADLGMLQKATLDSGAFPWPGRVLMSGSLVSMPPPSWYIPAWLAVQTPVYLIGLIAVLLLAGIRLAIIRGRQPKDLSMFADAWKRSASGGLLVTVQLIALPLYAVLAESSLYGGLRHLLFALPALAMITGILLNLLGHVWMRAVKAVLVAGFLITTVLNMAMHPYQYASFNLVAMATGVDNNWSVDFWRLSGRELVARTPPEGLMLCRPYSPGSWVAECESNRSFGPFYSERGAAVVTTVEIDHENQYWLLQYNREGTSLPNSCREVDRITRPFGVNSLTVGQVALCDFPEGHTTDSVLRELTG